VVVVNLDPQHRQAGWVDLDLDELGLTDDQPFQGHELLSDSRQIWRGRRIYVELDPGSHPAQVFLIRRQALTEQDFDYFV
ncbi:MAG TPA: hypothetical protein VGQ17_14740, partial [Gemmatimonadales bacterium]|nr:hypothetical protein [Gemmatimonadales bacterium]